MEAELSGDRGAQSPLPLPGVAEVAEWHPTHLRLTVLRARSLRPKAGAGSSSPYVRIQLQGQKYVTSVVPRSLDPEWREECTLQLPSRLDDVEEHGLVLTAMHRSPHRLDQFLGRLCLPLAQLFHSKVRRRNEWFGLQSKRGKPEKVRGQLQLDIQFLQILSPGSEPAFRVQGPQSLLTKLRSSMKGRRNQVYQEAQSRSLCMPNNEDSFSSITSEPHLSALVARGSSGGTTHAAGAAAAAMVPLPATELCECSPMPQLRTYLYKELAYGAPSTAAVDLHPASSPSQSDHREQPSSTFTQHLKNQSKPLKEERNTDSLGNSCETHLAALPPLPVTGEGGSSTQRSQTLHTSRLSLSHPASTKLLGVTAVGSGHGCVRTCQLQLLRGCQSCLRCFGLRVKP